MSTEKNKIIVFLDNIGRTIIGKVASETDTKLSVENPALVHVQPNPQQNNLQLQLLPLFFKEFLSDKSQSTFWNFNKNTVTISDEMGLAPQFVAQYEQIFTVIPVNPADSGAQPDVVKLFDDE